jgi:hypothetical protein
MGSTILGTTESGIRLIEPFIIKANSSKHFLGQLRTKCPSSKLSTTKVGLRESTTPYLHNMVLKPRSVYARRLAIS